MKCIIYHNSRCSKSREALMFLKEKKIDHEVIEYLKNHLDVQDLKNILKILNINAIDIVRKNEESWRQNYKEKFFSEGIDENKLIDILIQNPKLIERPIVMFNNKGVIARRGEKINELF